MGEDVRLMRFSLILAGKRGYCHIIYHLLLLSLLLGVMNYEPYTTLYFLHYF